MNDNTTHGILIFIAILLVLCFCPMLIPILVIVGFIRIALEIKKKDKEQKEQKREKGE